MRAARLVMSGCTYQEVADRLGYQNRGTVHRLVQPILRETRRDGVEEAFELHIARLEGLVQTHYERAMAGDHRATMLVLQVLREEARAWGFFTGVRATDTEPEQDYEVIDPSELVRRARERDAENGRVPPRTNGVA